MLCPDRAADGRKLRDASRPHVKRLVDKLAVGRSDLSRYHALDHYSNELSNYRLLRHRLRAERLRRSENSACCHRRQVRKERSDRAPPDPLRRRHVAVLAYCRSDRMEDARHRRADGTLDVCGSAARRNHGSRRLVVSRYILFCGGVASYRRQSLAWLGLACFAPANSQTRHSTAVACTRETALRGMIQTRYRHDARVGRGLIALSLAAGLASAAVDHRLPQW